METIAHIKVSDRDFYVYISLCTLSQNLHIFKYDDISCEYEIFPTVGRETHLQMAMMWIPKPIKRVRI